MGTRLFCDEVRGIDDVLPKNKSCREVVDVPLESPAKSLSLLLSLRCLVGSGCYRFPEHTEELRLEGMKLVDGLFGLCSMRLATLAGDTVDAISNALSDTCPCAKKKFCELERLQSTRFWRGGPMPQCFSCSCTFRQEVLAYGVSLTADFYTAGQRFSPYGKKGESSET